MMANSLGWYILSPGTFKVSWDGDWTSAARVVKVEERERFIVSSHSAAATFTIQPGFIPVTNEEGDFILIKAIANQRGAWFTAMEGLIEAWWQPGDFGIVCMINRPGVFTVHRGEPIAQMTVFKREGGLAIMSCSDEVPHETLAWRARRTRPDYRKDLDYLKGKHPDGRPEPSHLRSWHQAASQGRLQGDHPSSTSIRSGTMRGASSKPS
jgi:uncharacterized protein DUF6065